MKFHNCDIDIFPSSDFFGFPDLAAITSCVNVSAYNIISFDSYKKNMHKPDLLMHFFMYDHKFESIWSNPFKYISVFKNCDYVIMPDFSIYYDIPFAVSIYNKYRNHWLSSFFTKQGISVIPCILPFPVDSSFDWYTLGYPQNSVLAFSDIGLRYYSDIVSDSLEFIINHFSPIQILYFTRNQKLDLSSFDFSNFSIINLPFKEC